MNHRLFLQLFLPTEGVVRAYLMAGTGDRAAADDLLQEVSSVLWESFAKYDTSRPFKPWALGIARLEILKWRQRIARRRELLSDEAFEVLSDAAVEMPEGEEERFGHLQDCIRGLAPTARETVELRYRQELAIGQVATRIHKSVAAVEMTLVRARRALRDCIDRKLKAPEPQGGAVS